MSQNGRKEPDAALHAMPQHSLHHTFQASASRPRLAVRVPACFPSCTRCCRAPDFMLEYKGSSGTTSPPHPPHRSPSGLPRIINRSHHQREEARADIMQKTGVTTPERQIPDGARVSGGSVRVAGCVSGRTLGSLGTPLSVQNSVFLNAHHCVLSTLARPGPAQRSVGGWVWAEPL